MLAVIVAVSGLATVIAVSAVFGFDEGLAVGLLSGGMTQSAALGTGLSAIAELPIPEAAKNTLVANAPLADAITYGFGDLGLILFLTWLGPKIMQADLKQRREGARTAALGAARAAAGAFPPLTSACAPTASRTPRWPASSLAALEERYAGERLSVHRVQRDGELLTLEPTLALKRGDRLVVSALRARSSTPSGTSGPRSTTPTLLSVPVQTVSAVVTQRRRARRAPSRRWRRTRHARGVYLESLQRGTELMPREPWTVVAARRHPAHRRRAR